MRELKQLDKSKDEHTKINYKISLLSLINIVCSSAFIEGFMIFKGITR